MVDVETSPGLDVFWKYTKAFQSLDAHAIAAFFHQPALMVTPRGVHALADARAVEETYRAIVADLPARGYARTEFSHLTERRLADDLVLVTGAGTWVDQSGNGFMPFGLTYTLRRTGDVWRIVVALIHDGA